MSSGVGGARLAPSSARDGCSSSRFRCRASIDCACCQSVPTAPLIAAAPASESSSSPAVSTKVVVKDECDGIGGAAIARYALKLGDLIQTCMDDDGKDYYYTFCIVNGRTKVDVWKVSKKDTMLLTMKDAYEQEIEEV